MTEIPEERLNVSSFYGMDKNRNDTVRSLSSCFHMVTTLISSQVSVRGGHFLKENLALFDAPFFSITSAEAASMDVQQRGILETAYKALENGKYLQQYKEEMMNLSLKQLAYLSKK
jgi:hypothetical protein